MNKKQSKNIEAQYQFGMPSSLCNVCKLKTPETAKPMELKSLFLIIWQLGFLICHQQELKYTEAPTCQNQIKVEFRC